MADYLKIPEVARRLDVSEKTARRYIKAGMLPSTFIGGTYRVTEESLEEFLAAREVRPKDRTPSPEPSLFNGLEAERRASPVFARALTTAAEQLTNTEPPESLAGVMKRFGILDALYNIIEPLHELTHDPRVWDAFSLDERLEVSTTIRTLHDAAKQLGEQNDEYLERRRENAETRRASREAEARREQIREWTQRLSA